MTQIKHITDLLHALYLDWTWCLSLQLDVYWLDMAVVREVQGNKMSTTLVRCVYVVLYVYVRIC